MELGETAASATIPEPEEFKEQEKNILKLASASFLTAP